MKLFNEYLKETETPEYLESVRLAHYRALVKLAENFGFSKDSVGVSISNPQPPEFIAKRKLSIDMSMPPELASILKEKGLLPE